MSFFIYIKVHCTENLFYKFLHINKYYTLFINNKNNPINPKQRKIQLEINSINLVDILLPNSFPKKIANESLNTIPVIEPKISGIL